MRFKREDPQTHRKMNEIWCDGCTCLLYGVDRENILKSRPGKEYLVNTHWTYDRRTGMDYCNICMERRNPNPASDVQGSMIQMFVSPDGDIVAVDDELRELMDLC